MRKRGVCCRPVSVQLNSSVRYGLSVTLVYCIQTAKDIVKLLSQPGSPITNFLRPSAVTISKGNQLSGKLNTLEGVKYTGVGKIYDSCHNRIQKRIITLLWKQFQMSGRGQDKTECWQNGTMGIGWFMPILGGRSYTRTYAEEAGIWRNTWFTRKPALFNKSQCGTSYHVSYIQWRCATVWTPCRRRRSEPGSCASACCQHTDQVKAVAKVRGPGGLSPPAPIWAPCNSMSPLIESIVLFYAEITPN